MELFEYTAAKLSELLQTKAISSVELTNSVFKRIESIEKDVAAYITLTREEALAQAKKVDTLRMSGEAVSSLAGIPIAVKDNLCTKGVRTTCASKMLADFVPPYDATAITRLQEANAVLVGKTNMDEFAMGSSCETSYFKATRNPHNTNYVPGGSSGGSAAAVASGMAICSLGSDTGGSVRLPASFCGVIGLKPTYGSVSRNGLIAFASSFDQIGPIARSVDDIVMLYRAIAGKDERDATTVAYTAPADIHRNVKGMRIGIPKEYFADAVRADVREGVFAAAKVLEENGAILKEITLPSTEYALSAYYILSSAEASSNLARFDGVRYGYRTKTYRDLEEMYAKNRSEGFGTEVKRRILLGTFVLSSGYYDAYYKRAQLLQKRITAEFDTAFSSCDLILTPTAPEPAFLLGEKQNNPVRMYQTDIATLPVSIAGLPAMSVPCGYSTDGLPIGMQLIAPKWQEQRLFDAAGCYEALIGNLCPCARL